MFFQKGSSCIKNVLALYKNAHRVFQNILLVHFLDNILLVHTSNI